MITLQSSLQLFVRLVAIASLCMGLAGLIGYARLGAVLDRPLFVSPYFSLVLILCGLTLYPAHWKARFQRFAPLVVIVGIVGAFLASKYFEAWINGRYDSAAFATLLVLLGALAALFLRPSQGETEQIDRASLLVAVMGVAVSTFTAYALIENDIRKNQEFARVSAEAIASDIQHRLVEAEALMTRLGERWSSLDHLPDPGFIDQELFSYMRDFSFFESFAVVDSKHTVAWEMNRDASSLGWIEGLVSNRTLHDWLGHVQQSGRTHVTQSEHLVIDGNSGLAASPLSNPAMRGWFVIARMDLSKIMAGATSRDEDIAHFRITHRNSTIYQTPGKVPSVAAAVGELTLPVHHDFILGLSYWYERPHAKAGIEILPDFVLLVGLIFTFFLISSQGLAHVARQRSIQLHHRSLHDPLTGLPNRRLLKKTLEEACAKATSHGQPVSVAFFDLDGVKLINDSMGHDAVDGLLIEVAKRLRESVPDKCTVARLGGDEFVLVFSGSSEQESQSCTQALIDLLSRPYFINDTRLRVTASAGIAMGSAEVEDPMQLVRDADLAMLKAKQEGRNTWRMYTADMSAQLAERLALRNDLQTALDSGGLELHYQPIVDLRSGRIASVEALLRWPHPERGYIPPGSFIPMAERTGQIMPLTEWVIAAACHDSLSMRSSALPSFPIVVNISPVYFRRNRFVQDILKALEQAELPATSLQIEITEGVLLDNEEAAIQKLAALRSEGIKASIDDFGTGYSSLSYLKRLPTDKVKIDRSFIIDVTTDPADAAIVRSIISVAHQLGHRVVAEGVETEAQLEFLKENDCDEFQGYLFARPMPLKDLIATFA